MKYRAFITIGEWTCHSPAFDTEEEASMWAFSMPQPLAEAHTNAKTNGTLVNWGVLTEAPNVLKVTLTAAPVFMQN